ncbi:MAG: SLC13/DASS family transporter, partial [Paludibacteraceae bacterium]|nr:SLC13/DASS family transporter [Paludibacteraceae bacterium]
LLFFTSNKGLGLTSVEDAEGVKSFIEGTPVDFKAIMASFADPIVMLFLGGFVLASAASKVGLDIRLAKALLTPFGTNPKIVLLGLLLVIGMFSMFMSNTATAAMMIAILMPIFKELPADDKGRVALALAIPIACNIGGIGTPIGTPPNAIAIGALNTIGLEISFPEWMARMVPFALIMLAFSWMLLLVMFPFKAKSLVLNIKDSEKSTWKNYVVYATYIVTIGLWMTEQWTKINSNIVALLPFAVFTATRIFDEKDLGEINWSVLWMVAGGIALGTALNKTGLASVLVNAIPFGSWSPILVLVIAMLIGYGLSNFISNSAAANLLMPLLATVGSAMSNIAMVGGIKGLLVGLAVSTSFAMTLPISTPPNAIACSTGIIKTKDMAKIGIIIGIVGLCCAYALVTLIPFEA